ncbi:MAG: hypothetical protein ACK2U1_09870 [Anaerolineales bacterium]
MNAEIRAIVGMQYLYHYYEKKMGPFKNLSDLSLYEAKAVLGKIKSENQVMAAHRFPGYLERRAELEQIARKMFIAKGGKPARKVPHYMVVGECVWLQTWYEQGCFVKIPVSVLQPETISFSYGDLFPTFSPRVNDQKEYRRQIYTLSEIVSIIQKYGFPQEWNMDGKFGPERYIEVQVWDDKPLQVYLEIESKTLLP